MISLRNLATIIILALPFSWIIAYISMIQSNEFDSLALFVALSLFIGLWTGGILSDKVKHNAYLLVGIEAIPLLLGSLQLVIPQIYSNGLASLMAIVCLLFFCLGSSIVLMTVFLNQIASCNYRGRVAGILTMIVLCFGGIFSILWRLEYSLKDLLPGACALIILISLIIFSSLKPWRRELRAFLVPGSIKPYVAWWFIYIAAFLLYSLATPLEDRFLFQGFTIFGTTLAWTELVLIGVGVAAAMFALLPDWLGRKKVFSIASVLLGELCIFANVRFYYSEFSIWLMICEVFVIGFIVGVGAWLVWSEIGPIRMKGRRAAFGWSFIAVTGIAIWVSTNISYQIPFTLLVYPLAATLVLIGLYPITNATEVIWNERIVEDLEIRVDTKQVSKAIKQLEVDTSLQDIRQQIEAETASLTKIPGITRTMARQLRNEGYENTVLVASASVEILVKILGVSKEDAAKIKESAEKLAASRPKRGLDNGG
ncbi:MAG: helix-hairpin-helix domain-containing protein [Promethearchaeota archaeon]